MARTTDEIYNALVAKRAEYIPELSDSATAEWRLWLWPFAYGIHLFELILDLFKADVEEKLSLKQPGSIEWYIQKSKEFQLDDNLIVDEKGILRYPLIDEEKQIVKHASIVEENGGLQLKIAKYDEQGNLAPLNLTNGEFLKFQRYITNLKFAGTEITVTTLPADVVDYDIIVYYDPVYLPDGVQTAVIERLDQFRLELSFDGLFYTSDFVKAILEVEGVKTVKINSMNGTQGETTTPIDLSYQVIAGYFNFDEASVITMQNAKEQ